MNTGSWASSSRLRRPQHWFKCFWGRARHQGIGTGRVALAAMRILVIAILLPCSITAAISQRIPLWLPALLRIAVFLLPTVLLGSVVGSPLAPPFGPGNPLRALLEQVSS